jgi:hypothetical protein
LDRLQAGMPQKTLKVRAPFSPDFTGSQRMEPILWKRAAHLRGLKNHLTDEDRKTGILGWLCFKRWILG